MTSSERSNSTRSSQSSQSSQPLQATGLPTSSERQRDQQYEQLLIISCQACDNAAFEVAHHALAAAMYRARDLDDVFLLRELLLEAERQKKRIDALHPTHLLSSSSAFMRGHESVYNALQRQINVLLQFHEAQGSLQELKRQQR